MLRPSGLDSVSPLGRPGLTDRDQLAVKRRMPGDVGTPNGLSAEAAPNTRGALPLTSGSVTTRAFSWPEQSQIYFEWISQSTRDRELSTLGLDRLTPL